VISGTALRFIYPAAGLTWADMSHAFEWTPVANVLAYRLYVGTALDPNLVDSGDIQATSYLAANLPLAVGIRWEWTLSC
jgi:hypothetical protein